MGGNKEFEGAEIEARSANDIRVLQTSSKSRAKSPQIFLSAGKLRTIK